MQTLFVSSTFRDMHYERDAIRERALPKINAEARRYGQEISFCDLRWGINTLDLDGDEGSKKVVDVCLDQIDRCSPPMIVLLGARYGYIPDKSIIQDAARAKQFELEQLEISVTALEVEYGFLSRKNKPRALFYFRETVNAPDDYDSEDEEHAAKLARLKSRILDVVGDNYRTYKVDYSNGEPDMSSFADTVAADVTEALLPEWKQKARLSEFELDRKTQWDFVTDRSAICRGRDGLIDELANRIERGELRITVKGESGSGKSVVFSRLACVLHERGYDVLPFVGGLTTESNDSLDILRNTVLYLQNKLDGTPHGEILRMHADCRADEWRKLAAEYIDKYCDAGNKFVIMVDAVDQLYDDDLRKSNAFVPDCDNKGFVFFATCTDEFGGLDAGSLRITELSPDERKSVVGGIMSQYNRELDKTVVNAMVQLPAAGNPLYLSFLVKRLLMMNKSDYDEISRRGGQMDAISERQRGIIASCPSGAAEMCALLIAEAGRRINEKLISRVVEYLACSRFGLRQDDLAALIGPEWDTLDFLHFVMYLGDCFILRDDGRYDFSHKSIRQGILAATDAKHVHDKIAAYFWSIHTDEIAGREMLYHIINADNKRAFFDFTCNMAYEIAGATEKNKTSAVTQEAAQGAFGTYLMSALEFSANGGEWIAQAIAQAPCDNDSEAFPFITSVCGFAFMGTRRGEHRESLYAISKALLDYTVNAKQKGLESAEALLFSVQSLYSSVCALNNKRNEFEDVAADSYEAVKAAYRADPNDTTLNQFVAALRQKIVAPKGNDFNEAHLEEVYDVIVELADVTEERYEAEPNSMTALNNYIMLHNCLLWNFMCDNHEFLVKNLDEAFRCVSNEEFDDITWTTVFDLALSIGGLMLDDYMLNLQTGEYEAENESDIEDEDDDDEFDDEDDDDDGFDIEDLIAAEDDEETREFLRQVQQQIDDAIANANSDDYDDDEEDEDEDYEDEDEEDEDEDYDENDKDMELKSRRRHLSKAIERCFRFVLGTYAKLKSVDKRSGFESQACLASLQLSSMKIAEGDLEDASGCLRIGEEMIENMERDGNLTPDTRAMAYKIKSMRLTIRANSGDTDYADMITLARAIMRDAENMPSSSMTGNNALAESVSTLLGIYMQKLYSDYNEDKVDPSELAEAEALCDKLEKLYSQMVYVGDSMEDGLKSARGLIAMIKS